MIDKPLEGSAFGKVLFDQMVDEAELAILAYSKVKKRARPSLTGLRPYIQQGAAYNFGATLPALKATFWDWGAVATARQALNAELKTRYQKGQQVNDELEPKFTEGYVGTSDGNVQYKTQGNALFTVRINRPDKRQVRGEHLTFRTGGRGDLEHESISGLNRAHLIGDQFQGTGAIDGYNIVYTTPVYNQVGMYTNEKLIAEEMREGARVLGVVPELTLTVTVSMERPSPIDELYVEAAIARLAEVRLKNAKMTVAESREYITEYMAGLLPEHVAAAKRVAELDADLHRVTKTVYVALLGGRKLDLPSLPADIWTSVNFR